MKSDTERKRYHKEKLHRKKKRLHVHLSKELRSKIKKKKRSILARKGDTVKVLRGPGKGKKAKVSAISTVKRKVYVEGVTVRTARGREAPLALEPSNLMLVSLEPTKERKVLFSEDIFKAPKKEKPKAPPKKEKPKETKPAEKKPAPKAEEKPEVKKEKPKETKPPEEKPAPKAEEKKEEVKPAAPEAPKR